MAKPITVIIEPAAGGQLRTRPSMERAGHLHYTLKRDWRRDLDQEIKREGHDYFYPMYEHNLGNQPWPQNQPTAPDTPLPINLIHEVEAANGQRAVVAGTETTLYSFYPNLNSGPLHEPGDTPDDQYLEEYRATEWQDGYGTWHWPTQPPTDGEPPTPTDSDEIIYGGGEPGDPVTPEPPVGDGDGLNPPGGGATGDGLTGDIPPVGTDLPTYDIPAGYRKVTVVCGYYMFGDDGNYQDFVDGLTLLMKEAFDEEVAKYDAGDVRIPSTNHSYDMWEEDLSPKLSVGHKVNASIAANVATSAHNGLGDVYVDSHPQWTRATYFLVKNEAVAH